MQTTGTTFLGDTNASCNPGVLRSAFSFRGMLLFYCLALGLNWCQAEVSLISRNPFGLGDDQSPDDLNETVIEKIPNLEEEIEFCGSYSVDGTRKFSLLTKEDNKKHWMELSQSLLNFTLVKYDEDARALLIEFGGKYDVLPLRQASKLAAASRPVVRRPGLDHPKTSRSGPRRRIPSRTERPPRVLPLTPEFPEKIPSPPKRI